MCGIAGYYCWGDARPPVGLLKGLLLANMERGTNATGLAYLDKDGAIVYQKSEGAARDFIKAIPPEDWETIAASPRGLLHARATTKGSEKQNENNHPVVGLGWVVVHNGTIFNDDDLWAYYTKRDGVARFAEVDSSAVPLVLSRGKTLDDSLRHLTLLGGTATLAVWGTEYPEIITLVRLGHNDLYMFMDPSNKILYWSSASTAGYVAPGKLLGSHKFLTYAKLQDDHALILMPKLEDVRTVKYTRSPFVLPRAVAAPVVVLPRSGTTSTDTAFRKSSDSAYTGVKWSVNTSHRGKPLPKNDVFSNIWHNFNRISKAILANKAVMAQTVETGYGRWELVRNKLEGLDTEFKPYRRTKRWWKKRWPEMDIILPLPSLSRDLDGWLTWENYHIGITTGTTRRYLLGFLCPWCGVWLCATDVNSEGGRCQFCLVQSSFEIGMEE